MQGKKGNLQIVGYWFILFDFMPTTQILIDAYIFSVRRIHALAPIPIPAILAPVHVNVTQRQNARELYHTALTR